MTIRTTENHPDIADTVMTLAAEAVHLQSRVNELLQELADVNEHMTAIASALDSPRTD